MSLNNCKLRFIKITNWKKMAENAENQLLNTHHCISISRAASFRGGNKDLFDWLLCECEVCVLNIDVKWFLAKFKHKHATIILWYIQTQHFLTNLVSCGFSIRVLIFSYKGSMTLQHQKIKDMSLELFKICTYID